MIIDVERHKQWILASCALALLSTVIYLASELLSAGGHTAGSWTGLFLAFAGTFIILFECMLSWRKRYPASPLGRVSFWLRAHIWLGLLSFWLILLHAGFRFGEGLAYLLMWLFVVITLSGVFGVVLQNWLPRVMMERVQHETLYDQIPHVIRELRLEADERVEFVTADLGIEDEEVEYQRAGGVKMYWDPSQKAGAREKEMVVVMQRKAAPQIETDEQTVKVMKAHYLQEIRPYLVDSPSGQSARLFRTRETLAAYFNFLRMALPVATHPVLNDLEEICEQRRQLAVQKRLHHWLHGWLYVHLPLSMAFLVLTAVHAVVSLRY